MEMWAFQKATGEVSVKQRVDTESSCLSSADAVPCARSSSSLISHSGLIEVSSKYLVCCCEQQPFFSPAEQNGKQFLLREAKPNSAALRAAVDVQFWAALRRRSSTEQDTAGHCRTLLQVASAPAELKPAVDSGGSPAIQFPEVGSAPTGPCLQTSM